MLKTRHGKRRSPRTLVRCTSSVATAVALVMLVGCEPSKHVDLQTLRQQVASGQQALAMPGIREFLAGQPSSAEGHLLLGEVLLQQRDAKLAEVEFRRAKDLGVTDDQVLPKLAESMLDQGNAAKLISEYGSTQLRQAEPAASLKAIVAEAHLQQGEEKLAQDYVDAALTLIPDHVRSSILKARLLATAGKGPEAIKFLDALNDRIGRKNGDVWKVRGDVQLYALGEIDEALKSYREAIAVRPDQISARFSIVQIHLFRNDGASAKNEFETLKKLAPNLLQTRFVEAQLAFSAKDFVRAKSLTQALLAVMPDNPQLLTFSGAVFLQTRDLNFGEANLSKALKLDSNMVLTRKLLAQTRLLRGQPAAALSDLLPLIEAPRKDTSALTLAAEAYLAQGDFAHADEMFQSALKVDPKDVNVRMSAALSRLARGDGQALLDLEQIAKVDSSDTAALALVTARVRRRELDAAMTQVDSLLARSEPKASYFDLKGSILLDMGDLKLASQEFQKAIALDPGYFPAVKKLAIIDQSSKDFDAVKRRLEAFVKSHPRNSEARMAFVDWMIFTRQPKEEVAKSLDDIIRLDPVFVPARVKLIQLHLAAKAPKQAVSVAQDAVTANPDQPVLLDLLAQAQVAASELQQAQVTLQKLVSLQPKSPVGWGRMADLQMLLKNEAGAEASLRRAIELAPNDIPSRRRLMAMAIAAKQPERALNQARDMQRSQPKSSAGFLFEAEIESEQKRWAAAANALEAGLKAKAEPWAVISSRLYLVYQASGDAASADRLWQQMDAGGAKTVDFFVRLGEIQLLRKNNAAAEQAFREVIKQRPEDLSALNNVAWTMAEQHKKGASVYSARAVALGNSRPELLDTHAVALAADGQVEAAIAAAEAAVKAKPDSGGYRLTLAKMLALGNQKQRAREEATRARAADETNAGFAKDVDALLNSLR